MWPVGTYERLIHDIKMRETPDIPITFGVLIADHRQQKAREYVLNYITRFDKLSERYINFYLPGYLEKDAIGYCTDIKIRGTNYAFNAGVYLDFLSHFCYDFDIDYPYNPVLILLEYNRGHFKKSRKIVIELDENGAEIERAGRLIETIVDIARKHVELEEFSSGLQQSVVRHSLFERIIEGIDNAIISSITKGINDTQKYRID